MSNIFRFAWSGRLSGEQSWVPLRLQSPKRSSSASRSACLLPSQRSGSLIDKCAHTSLYAEPTRPCLIKRPSKSYCGICSKTGSFELVGACNLALRPGGCEARPLSDRDLTSTFKRPPQEHSWLHYPSIHRRPSLLLCLRSARQAHRFGIAHCCSGGVSECCYWPATLRHSRLHEHLPQASFLYTQ